MDKIKLDLYRNLKYVKPYPVVMRYMDLSLARPQVDMRPTIKRLNLAVRDQGSRGVCSVMAITFLLEYMYGTRLVLPEKDLSIEYLNYVCNLGVDHDGGFFKNINSGYQEWGIVTAATVPFQTVKVTTIAETIMDAGRRWTRFKDDFIKSWIPDPGASEADVDRAIEYLDQDIPVAIGSMWPNEDEWSTTMVKGVEIMGIPATASGDHSVALVGYRRDNSFPGGGYFVFRNSWGAKWGDNGYGYMPFGYAHQYSRDLLAYTTHSITSNRLSIQAIAAQSDKLEVVAADNAGTIHVASWQQNVNHSKWRGWWTILKGKSISDASVSVVARDPNKLDVFMAGIDGKTYSAACTPVMDNGQWRGWWNILSGDTLPGGNVTAVSRDPKKLDIFIVGKDGGVYTAAWDANVDNQNWRGWWRIGTLLAQPGAPVSVVSRDPNKLDIFVAGEDGKTYTAAWDQYVDSGKWRGWWNILTGDILPGGTVAAVSRDPKKLDIFIVGKDGGVYTAAWDANVDNQNWRGWWRIGL